MRHIVSEQVRMYTPPTLLYVGPMADAVEEAWRDSDAGQGFEGLTVTGLPVGDSPVEELDAEGVDPVSAVSGALAERQFDAVVCDADGSFDGLAVVETVRDHSRSIPLVVFSVGDSVTMAAATELGADSYVQIAADSDRVERLAALGPLIQRRRTQRRESTMLDSLLGNVPLSIYFKDRQSRHVRVSDEVTRLTGPSYLESPDGKRHHTPEDVEGKTDYDLYPADLSDGAVADDQHVIETGESIDDRVEHAYGDDLEETYVTTAKAPWRDEEGDVLGVVGVTRDITERKKYEKQLERQNERLERFARVISHDLRNPLEVALARLEFAREDGDREHFDSAERALHRIDDLVDDVLTLAREGETVSDPEPVDLARVSRDAWDVVSTERATLDLQTDATFLADAGRLQQLLENVFRNAIEHAGPEVTVTVGDLVGRQGFFVADDGPGIPEEDRENVFDSGFSTGEGGTGLGLSIVRTIAEAHGWEVAVTEHPAEAVTGERDGSATAEAGAALGARFEFGEVSDGLPDAADRS